MSEREKVLLVVDDVPDNIHLLSGVLKGKYKVKAATSGEKALLIAARAPSPDLILLDVMMPHMDGYEVCRRLKADTVTRDIPVIFLTGHVDDVERQRGLGLGAVAYLSRPVAADTLLDIVERTV